VGGGPLNALIGSVIFGGSDDDAPLWPAGLDGVGAARP